MAALNQRTRQSCPCAFQTSRRSYNPTAPTRPILAGALPDNRR